MGLFDEYGFKWIKMIKHPRYVPVSYLDRFIPWFRENLIYFLFSEKDLNPDTGKRIVSFLEELENKNVDYSIVEESLPKCIFDFNQKANLKKFKIQKRILLDKCLKCVFFSRKECRGVIKCTDKPGKHTIFDNLSVHDILYLTKIKEKNSFDDELNLILDKMFELKSENADIIYWDYPEHIADTCDYDFVFHFIEAKLNLDRKEELTKNQKLMRIVKNTYEKYKPEYARKKKLVPRDNRWTKLIIVMNWLNLLSKEEIEFWIKKYAYYEFSDSEPKLPQAWNRVWAFILGLGISNIDDLKKIKTIDFHKAENIICSYVPTFQDLFEQNVFSEAKNIMLIKYVRIRRFCNKPLFEEVDSVL